MNEAYNMDCMEGMKQYEDNHFDLAIVDPPYGSIDQDDAGVHQLGNGGTWAQKLNMKKVQEWNIAPNKAYWDELFRVSKNQIIWGGNYFDLPPTRCFIVWRKLNVPENFSMAMAEYAWTSFYDNAKVYEESAAGQKYRIHPTQKPVQLYKWILKNYANDGDKILDTHLGSGSSRIACYDAGYDFVGYEIDKEYFKLQEERFKEHTSQLNMFIDF